MIPKSHPRQWMERSIKCLQHVRMPGMIPQSHLRQGGYSLEAIMRSMHRLQRIHVIEHDL